MRSRAHLLDKGLMRLKPEFDTAQSSRTSTTLTVWERRQANPECGLQDIAWITPTLPK